MLQKREKPLGPRESIRTVGRWRKVGCAGLWGLAALALLGQDALATHQIAHCRPEPADILFAPDFPALQDHEWGYPIGGWGGVAKGIFCGTILSFSFTAIPVMPATGMTRAEA